LFLFCIFHKAVSNKKALTSSFSEDQGFNFQDKKPTPSHFAKKRGNVLQAGILAPGISFLLEGFPTLHPFPQVMIYHLQWFLPDRQVDGFRSGHSGATARESHPLPF